MWFEARSDFISALSADSRLMSYTTQEGRSQILEEAAAAAERLGIAHRRAR